MAFASATLIRYKLHSVFSDSGTTVIHTPPSPESHPVITRTATWKTEEKLGSGAFGEVWRQRDQDTGEIRAVKIVSRLHFNVRELEAMVELQDRPDLFVLFLGWYDDPHATYIAMEYLEHGDLGRYIAANRLAESEAKAITTQILHGLVILHSKGICHRDLKPQNILISSISPIHVKITDFGISKRAIGTSLRTGCGTLLYQSPEQLGLLPKAIKAGKSYTNAIDIWALGVVVHEILTAEIPFLEADPGDETLMSTGDDYRSTKTTTPTREVDMDLLYRYCRGPEQFPTELMERSSVSESGREFVKSLMAVDPRKRATAADALDSLWLTTDRPGASRMTAEYVGILLAKKGSTAVMRVLGAQGEREIWDLQCDAIATGNLPVMKSILSTAATMAFEPREESWLQLAAKHNQIEVMKLLLASGTDPNEELSFSVGLTALQEAAHGGHLAAIELLLRHGAEVNAAPAYTYGRTALQAAAYGGHLDSMKLLLSHAADVNAAPANANGLTSLQAAAYGGHLDAIDLLLGLGADVNEEPAESNGLTALQAAARGGHHDATTLLLRHGANINAGPCENSGLTALAAAAQAGHLEVMRTLLNHGADANSPPGGSCGLTPLQAASRAGHQDAMQLLLTHCADVNAAPAITAGLTALQAAAEGGSLPAMTLLLAHGADVNAPPAPSHGLTALQAVSQRGDVQAIELLLGLGANVNAAAGESHGLTALQAAARGVYVEAVGVLLRNGAVVDAVSRSHMVMNGALGALLEGLGGTVVR